LGMAVLAYDADCGPCSRFRSLVEFLDARGVIRYTTLGAADHLGSLNDIPPEARYGSFQLILADGHVVGGGDAIPSLVELLPFGKKTAKLLTTLPGGTWLVKIVYSSLSRLHETGYCRKEPNATLGRSS